MDMRWGKIAVMVLASMVALGFGLAVAAGGDTPSTVDEIELDARREDDASDGEIRDDDEDDDRGDRAETEEPVRAADATDGGRDGTREGDTRGERGTGTGDTGGGFVAVEASVVGDTADDGAVASASGNEGSSGNDTSGGDDDT
jgi:hypothetical protein